MKRVHEQEVNDWIEREVGARFDEGVMEQYTATALFSTHNSKDSDR
jgi:hypothetical protein